MAPGLIANEIADLLVGRDGGAGRLLLLDDAGVDQRLGEFADELDALDHRIQILVLVRRALGEIFEIDIGALKRIGRFQLYDAGPVVGVGL